VGALRNAGFTNISIDLIFALPDALRRSWNADLVQAIALEPDHISLYGLTVEPHTPIARWETAGTVIQASEDRYAEDFLLAHKLASDAGFTHYEVSNFARPGKRSRHNSVYWSGAPYIGIGPSAHSFDGSTRSWNVPQYSEWIDRLSAGEAVLKDAELLTAENRSAERIYLGLRTESGLAASDTELERARTWRDEGWARIDGDLVRLTPEGWLRLDSLAAGLTGL
jgi:oxygen-independent coproporphyrinogen-3 oxidase